MITPELKPCPFCGGPATLHEVDWCEPSEWNCECACGARTAGDTNREQAVAFWNRRA